MKQYLEDEKSGRNQEDVNVGIDTLKVALPLSLLIDSVLIGIKLFFQTMQEKNIFNGPLSDN